MIVNRSLPPWLVGLGNVITDERKAYKLDRRWRKLLEAKWPLLICPSGLSHLGALVLELF